MEELLRNIGGNPWYVLITIIGTVASIIAIPLAFIFYFKQKKKKRLFYSLRKNVLIENLSEKLGDIEVSYKEEKINNLTFTKIAIWNAGNETINYDDIAISDYLRVIFTKNNTLIQAKIIYHRNIANAFQLVWEDNSNQIKIIFEYINPNEGCVLQFVHTGETEHYLFISGTIKGVGKIESNVGISSQFNLRELINTILVTVSFSLTFTFVINYFVQKETNLASTIFFSLLGYVLALVYLYLKYKKDYIPKGFEGFN